MVYLVTDDSKLARLGVVKSLKVHFPDAEIFQAENGQVAIDTVKAQNIDIAFLDLTMPVMDGYEALPLMIEANPDLKIIIISADVQEKAKQKVLDAGAKMHVRKPINVDKMKEILDNL